MSDGVSRTVVPTLDYAPDPRHRRFRRRIVWGSTALAIILAVYFSWGFISFRIQQAYWFERCMNHVTPPETVLYEWIGIRQDGLNLTNQDYVNGLRYAANVPPGFTAAPSPASQYRNRLSPASNYVIYIPRELRELEKYVYFGKSPGLQDIVFLGARKRPDGKSRLVIMRGSAQEREMIPDYLQAYVCSPPDFLHVVAPPTITAKLPARSALSQNRLPNLVTLDTGIADPNDPTHITIPVKFNTRPDSPVGTIDAYLQNDDTLRFSLRQ